jgi:hypothetical protein
METNPNSVHYFICACKKDRIKDFRDAFVKTLFDTAGGVRSDNLTTDLVYLLQQEGVYSFNVASDQWILIDGQQLMEDEGITFWVECDKLDDGLAWLWLYLIGQLPTEFVPS